MDQHDKLDREFHDRVLEQMFELWVEPAIAERGLDLGLVVRR